MEFKIKKVVLSGVLLSKKIVLLVKVLTKSLHWTIHLPMQKLWQSEMPARILALSTWKTALFTQVVNHVPCVLEPFTGQMPRELFLPTQDKTQPTSISMINLFTRKSERIWRKEELLLNMLRWLKLWKYSTSGLMTNKKLIIDFRFIFDIRQCFGFFSSLNLNVKENIFCDLKYFCNIIYIFTNFFEIILFENDFI